uniref:Peptidase S1 domain-containing protein n=1 Tax=Rhodnius prolixus TaxID=13249 RepID=T1HMT4_RHOPR
MIVFYYSIPLGRQDLRKYCIDVKRKLRCVIKENCLSRRIVSSKNCPTGRVCCRKHKSNPYLSLRKVPNSTILPLIEIRNRVNQDSDRLVFPSELENTKYETATSTINSSKINKKKENDKYKRVSKSDGNMNLVYEEGVVNRPPRSVLECKRYTRILTEYSHFMPLLPDATPKKITMSNCKPQINPLIVGGKNASITDYPHMAALGYKRFHDTDYLCGGTLISENFVLTAGHCADTRWGPPVVVHLGSTELYSNEAIVIAVKHVAIHPKYKPPSSYNDIALIKLNHSLTLSLSVRPACLPTLQTEMQTPNHMVIATGWGKTGFGK